ncbi:MAG: hypothetical protein M3552_12170, partial [Planctomycetota bacterium]|nr:hypothetical protein [Planctomycetota bacterium]
EALRMLPRLAMLGPPRSHPELRQGRCASVRVRSTTPLAVHTDGELFCTPDEGVHELEVRIVPKRLRVKVCAV